jgi:hypothetical protein
MARSLVALFSSSFSFSSLLFYPILQVFSQLSFPQSFSQLSASFLPSISRLSISFKVILEFKL